MQYLKNVKTCTGTKTWDAPDTVFAGYPAGRISC
jgi:hypothetical protein